MTEKIVDKKLGFLKSADSLFDMLSECMMFLVDNVKDEQQFVFSMKNLIRANKTVHKFVNRISKVFRSIDNELFEKKREAMLGLVKGVSVWVDRKEPGKKDMSQEAIVVYSIMEGICIASMEWNDFGFKTIGPLDRKANLRYRVYIRPKYSAINSYRKEIHREPRKELSLLKAFNRFVFLDSLLWREKRKTAGIPKGKIVLTGLKGHKKLRIGLCPCLPQANFDFADDKEGRNFVKYKKEDEQNPFVSCVLKALERAMEEGCQIFVLPEYSASSHIKNLLKSAISEARKNGKKTPLLTLSGSSWTNENNNVMEIYNRFGKRIGEYYKYSAFRDNDDQPQIIECIQDPGKEIVYFYLQGFGEVLPSICRDASDGDYTDELAEIFWPLIVVISAYSPSVMMFSEPMEKMASYYFSSSVLCNNCQARAMSKKELNLCVLPQKTVSVPKYQTEVIQRDKACSLSCKTSCLYICDINYSFRPGETDSDLPRQNTSIKVHKKKIENIQIEN